MRARLVAALLLAVVARSAPSRAQVRQRRPMAPAPDVRYGFDNNGATGCRDYNCGARCYDGHSGTDFSLVVGTAVLAGADGVVTATNNGCANVGSVGNTCGAGCGNYVQLQHSDGSRTVFCHMQLNSIAVSRGQRVRCGETLGRSASSGNSTGPHLHFGWRRTASAASADPFRGRCTSAPGVWTDQRTYPQSPAATCACVPSTEVCNGRDDDCDGRVDDGVCVMDASVAPDAASRDAAVDRADVTDRGALTDVTAELAADVPVDADARVDAEATSDAGFVDDAPPPPDGDEVAPDQEARGLEGGCGCRGQGARARGGASALVLAALLGLRRRSRARRGPWGAPSPRSL
jgi:hypothetical protein